MYHCTENHFFFSDVLKRWYFQKNWAGIWSFLYYRERWYSFFPKIWSYTLDGKWKGRASTWSFLYYLERWYFFPENMIFFPWWESERRSFSGYTRKNDASPREEKQETRYIGFKCGLSFNLFGWRYSAMNNIQYFVPFSPQVLCLGACLGGNKGNHLSIRG